MEKVALLKQEYKKDQKYPHTTSVSREFKANGVVH